MRAELKVMGIPVGKQRPRISTRTGFARAYTPQKTVDYEDSIKDAWAKSRQDQLDGDKYVAYMRFYFPVPQSYTKKRKQELKDNPYYTKKPDVDNCVKSVLDALNGLAYEDDAMIFSIHASKYYSDEPRTEITIVGVDE